MSYQFGHKMKRKSWEGIDPEKENRNILLVFLGLAVFMLFLTGFMWLMRNSPHR